MDGVKALYRVVNAFVRLDGELSKCFVIRTCRCEAGLCDITVAF